MFSDLVPHDAYKHPGEAGLAPVPQHWEVKPMRAILRGRSKRNRADLPLLSVARERGVFIRSADDDNHNAIPDDLTNYKVALAGDLVINKMKAWQGSLGLAPCDGLVSPAYFVYGVDFDNRYYLQALLRSRRYVDLFAAASDGVRIGQWDLAINRFRGLPVLVPSAVEQAAIVKYLAHAHHRIDRAIAAKRKLIALLEEQKQAIINQAVTRGLDPTAPLKDTGIPWLGHVPVHWDVRKVRSLFARQGSGTTPPDPSDYGDELPWVMSGDLNDRVVTETKRSVTHSALERLSALKLYPAGSLIVAMYGATIGKTGLTGMPATTNQACCVFSAPRPGMDVRYLQHALRTSKPGLLVEAFGGGQPNVNADVVRQLRVPVPPATEQAAIAEHLIAATQTLSNAISRSRREIDLLREFRTRLTSDVVTGQVDVRRIAVTLPETDPVEAVVDDGGADDDLFDEVHEYLEDVDE